MILTLLHLLAALTAPCQSPPEWTQGLVVYQVTITGTVQPAVALLVSRAVSEAALSGGAAIVLDIDVRGGSVDVAQEIAAEIRKSTSSVYAFVRQRAWDAGALIALATDSVFMRPGSSIGADAAKVRRPSRTTATAADSLREEFGHLAEQRGIDRRLGEAMVDRVVAIEGVVEAGALLEPGSRTGRGVGGRC